MPRRGKRSATWSAISTAPCSPGLDYADSAPTSAAVPAWTETASRPSVRLTRPESTLPVPTSTKRSAPSAAIRSSDCAQRTGAVEQAQTDRLRVGGRLGGHVEDDRARRDVERQRVQCLLEAVAGERHERAVEGARDRERDHAPGARLRGQRRGALDGRGVARDHDLARVVVVGRDHLALARLGGLAADGFERIGVECQDGRHRARAHVARGRHFRLRLRLNVLRRPAQL